MGFTHCANTSPIRFKTVEANKNFGHEFDFSNMYF